MAKTRMNERENAQAQEPEPQLQAESLFDVIVVGAGLAGCTAARLFAMEGLRVGFVEHHRDNAAFKQLCTHFIQASATPTLRRLGLDRLIEEAGGLRNGLDIWSRYGWTGGQPPFDAAGQPAFGYNIQRRTLDPMLRKLAAETAGITPLFGCSVQALVGRGAVFDGVRLNGARAGVLRTRLIIGADGRNSAVAKVAGIKASSSENSRFGAIRAYRNVALRRGTCSQMWFRGGEIGYVFPNDDGITVIAYMATKERLDAFRTDPGKALERSMAVFPDCPELASAEPQGDTLVIKDYPNLWRPPTVRNIAFVGDALMSIDPLWGVGCGFAFQSAEWLVDAIAPALKQGQPLARALKRYTKRIARQLNGHRFIIVDYARRRGFNAIEKLTFSAAAKDTGFSRHLHAYGARMIGPARFLSPAALARAAWINLRRPSSLTAQPSAPA